MSISDVKAVADPIAEKLKNIRTVKVVQNQNDIPGMKEEIDAAFSRFQLAKTLAEKRPTEKNRERAIKRLEKYLSVAKNDIEGAYARGELYLVASNLHSTERVHEVLRHEVAHLSVKQMLEQVEPGLYRKFVADIRILDKAGNKYIRELAKAVDKTQPVLDANRRAEEIIAQIAERGDHERNMPNAVGSMSQRMIDALKGLTDQDARDIVAQALRWAHGEGDIIG